MKKILRSLFIVCLILVMLVPTAFAMETEEVPEWYDVQLSDEEIAAIFALNPNNPANSNASRASDLIHFYSIAINKDGNTLYIVGKTSGTTQVVKAGFKEVVIQRRASSSASWSDYITYEDLYWDENAYNLAKAVTVPSGYQYRVTCIHYAKKNIFSVQKIDNVSNILTF